jgi:hypothetical protein
MVIPIGSAEGAAELRIPHTSELGLGELTRYRRQLS